MKFLPEDSSYRIYESEMRSFEMFTLDEELALGKRIQKGDDEAAMLLVKHNLRFAANFAKRYVGLGLAYEDLVNEANIGLMTAARKYDPAHKIRFVGYAQSWVRRKLQEAVLFGRCARVPVSAGCKNFSAVKAYIEAYHNKHNTWPEAQKVEEDLGVTHANACGILALVVPSVSLDTDAGELGTDTLKDYLYSNLPDTDASAEAISIGDLVDKILSDLTDRERFVIIRRFGLDNHAPMRLWQIGDLLGGLTRERVRQIEKQALLKARESHTFYYLREVRCAV